MRRVMVGLDGSPTSAEASRWSAWLAAKTGAELIGATAWMPQQSEATPEDRAERRESARTQLETEWCEPARSLEISPRALLVEGPPDALLAASEAEDVDLLVVGSRGHGRMASLHVGSVAHHLARHTLRPLAIVPAGTAEVHPGTIVVGVDGSAGSAAALRWCAEVAVAVSAQVTAVTSWEPFLQMFPDHDPRSQRHRVERQMDEWLEPLRGRGVEVTTEIVRDVHPVAAIAETARGQAQLIVVGTHGLGGFPGMRLGGVAVQLVHHVSMPVVLVPVSVPAP